MEQRICTVEGCTKPARRRCLCGAHYSKFLRHGDANISVYERQQGQTCKVDGCDSPAKSKGMCFTHYFRLKQHGDVTVKKARHRGERTLEQKRQQQIKAGRTYHYSARGREANRLRRQVRRGLGKYADPEDKLKLKEMLTATHCPLCAKAYTDMKVCFRTRKTIDHIHPLKHGGKNELSNLRVICQSCNSRKQSTLQ